MSTKKDVFSAKLKEQKVRYKIEDVLHDVQNSDICLSENAPQKGLRTEQYIPENVKAPFMFVGINPSMRAHDFADNNEKSICFRDEKLGKWINKICRYLIINVNKEIFTTNIVKYPTINNEEPTNQQVDIHYKEFFIRELLISKPRLIFACGNFVYDQFNRLANVTKYNDNIDSISFNISENEQYECLLYKVPHPAYFERGGDFEKTKNNLLLIQKDIKFIKLDYYFTHLHVHDSYSLKDGVGLPKERIQWAIENDKSSLATTNHGNISNWMMMHTLCHKENIKPILGIEAYFNRYSEQLREALKNDEHKSIVKRKNLRKKNSHVTLLAKNLKGYYNIISCSNDAWVNGFYMYPYMSPNVIEKHAEGVICLSGCSGSEANKILSQKYYLESDKRKQDIDVIIQNKTRAVSNLYNQKNVEKFLDNENIDDYDLEYFNSNKNFNEQSYIKQTRNRILNEDKNLIDTCYERFSSTIDWWHNIYKDDFYIEIMVISYPLQIKINQELIKIAKEKNIKIVLTHDVHYTYKDGWALQQLQMLNDQNKTFNDLENDKEEKIWVIKSKDLYYKNVYELYESWETLHKSDIFTEEVFFEACQNTIEISNKVENFEVDKSNKLPKLTDNGYELIVKLSNEGLIRKGLHTNKEYVDRMNFELDIINKKGFVDYFLVVQEMINWVKTNYTREHVGSGRGCFTPETKILMENGELKNINEIEKNDKIVSSFGSSRKVLNKFEYEVNEQLCSIKLKNDDSINCTKDHKIYCIPKGKEKIIKNAIWKEASKLQNGDFLIKL